MDLPVFGGVPTFARVFDAAIAGAGAPALALHCALAHSGIWAGVAQGLPELCLTAIDLLGHGRSGDWEGRGDYHRAVTRQAMGAMPSGPVHLIGHSFGATVALRIALEDMDHIASLTLIEPVLFCAARSAGGPEFSAHLAQHAGFAAALAAGDAAQAAAAFQGIWGRDAPFDALPAHQRCYIMDRIGLIAAQNPALLDDAAGLLTYGRLEGLGVPVLLLEGADSPAVIGAVNAELARRLPQVQRVVVPGAGHMLPVTHAADCAGVMAKFIANTGG
ncbi:Pimeloyl-ACP methyl ester carboxylesterase [Pseudorhodobacter antarcticus]|jgi:pimeloyl-ACP methyl ester carboxylesterase|uniref:Pimeloyl-ACP methyl ester carboxylesterase n=1 Tax=Pseudorhodobacter antarcticus TaxID=1077947 RepID=A0A1H8FWV1_9RHOB|nr:alpha/beta hydrolase [Pseudorhodobacter antarcticus]SEN36014.1 Pimeloyl-ACP methyl ester carboxylesterase [Pseudorhodobacter antarcticus]